MIDNPAIDSLEQAKEAIVNGLVKFADPAEIIENQPTIAGVSEDGKAVSLCSVGSMSMWVGVQKAGKSTILAMLCASVLDDIQGSIFHTNHYIDRILYVDTEQPRKFSNRNIQKIYKYLGSPFNSDVYKQRIRYMECKEFGIAEILLLVRGALEIAIDEGRPFDLVVLDGVADLVLDVNNPAECDGLIRNLGKFSEGYNAHFAHVIHANPGAFGETELKARGHLGSALMRKVEAVVTIKKDRDTGTFTVDFPYLRDGNLSKKELEFYEGDKLLHPVDIEERRNKMQQYLHDVFSQMADFQKHIFLKDVKDHFNCGDKTAMKKIDQAVEVGVLEYMGTGPHNAKMWRINQ